MFLKQFLIGLTVTALGVGMTWRADIALEFIGQSWWAERNFGPGGSRFLYKLIGILVSIIGIIVMTDLFDVIIGGLFYAIFGKR